MKLNLLPKRVAKNVQSKAIFAIMLVLVLVSLGAAFLYQRDTSKRLQTLKTEVESYDREAQKVRDIAAEADTIVAEARVLLTNVSLVNQIDRSTQAYPDLYDELLNWIPSFFRVRTMTAESADATTATITIQGYLKTFQQYSDVMIALLRYPNAVSVGRSGFAPVPAGNEAPFGYDSDTTERGPIPGWSAVTLTLVVANRPDIMAPDPLPTLTAAGTGAGVPGMPAGASGAPSGGSAPAGRSGPPGSGGGSRNPGMSGG